MSCFVGRNSGGVRFGVRGSSASSLRSIGDAASSGFSTADRRRACGVWDRRRRNRAMSGSVMGSYNSVKSPVESTDTTH